MKLKIVFKYCEQNILEYCFQNVYSKICNYVGFENILRNKGTAGDSECEFLQLPLAASNTEIGMTVQEKCFEVQNNNS